MNSPSNNRPGDVAESRLRDLYRELAVETTPPELDARILADARAALRDRPAPSRIWMRPLAVAATLGLCVALVLEIGTGPDGTPVIPDPAADTREEIGHAARESRAQKMGESQAAKALPATNSFSDAVAAPGERPARGDTSAAGASSDDLRERESPDAPSDALARQAVRPEAALLEEAVVPATQSGTDEASAGKRQAVDAVARGCDERATRDAGLWLDCIDKLEAAGERALAASERRRRRAAFPDAD